MGTVKFYKDEPLFGLDIGHASLKAMQIVKSPGKPPEIVGYGSSQFEPAAIQNGVIVNPEAIAASVHQLFETGLVGTIDSRRVACTLPTAHTFSRPMTVPPMSHDQIVEAVHLEAEQYIPIPLDSLYIDYEVSHQDSQGMELLLVAASRKIVDSYHSLLQSLELEPVAFEPSINASSRLLKIVGSASSEPSILVDIGTVATDIALFENSLLVSSTVNGGGDTFTNAISKSMHLSVEQATRLKNEYGISYSDKQQRIIDAVKPQLETLSHEIEKSIRYYSERAGKGGKKITRIVTVGGGAVMPGFNQYVSKELRLPCESLEPWDKISFGHLTVPEEIDRPMFITVAGEAIIDPAEISK
jgi:type IV pilus assembly protein PilM